MTSSSRTLLAELHAHTTWSDGELAIRDLVDLYGRAGFDVIAVTDHVVRASDDEQHVVAAGYAAYLEGIELEAERAERLYGLMVIPGLELSFNDPDPLASEHAVAIGLRAFVSVDSGLEHAVAAAREHGAAIVAAHPYTPAEAEATARRTAGFAADPDRARTLVDRFELINRHEVFPWVSDLRLPVVASGDFHERGHLTTWKTRIPALRSEGAVLEYLRSPGPVELTRLDRADLRRAA